MMQYGLERETMMQLEEVCPEREEENWEKRGNPFGEALCEISAVNQGSRFSEFHKIRNQLLPMIADEEELDSDLRCYIKSLWGDKRKMKVVNVFMPAFDEGMKRLQEAEDYFLDMYCKCPGNFGKLETAMITSKLQWTRQRVVLKRKFLYILLTGVPFGELSSATCGGALDRLISSSFPSLTCISTEKPRTKNKTLRSEFLNAGMSKTRTNFSKQVKAHLLKWFDEHIENPYPSETDKEVLSKETGLNVEQISTWFINQRVRKWKRSNHAETNPKKRKFL